jgi:hypothetical protein
LNVNDVSIDGFAGSVRHSTTGGETVVILGSNFGPANHSISAIFTVSYRGVDGNVYASANCVRGGANGTGNSQLLCPTVPGAGTPTSTARCECKTPTDFIVFVTLNAGLSFPLSILVFFLAGPASAAFHPSHLVFAVLNVSYSELLCPWNIIS